MDDAKAKAKDSMVPCYLQYFWRDAGCVPYEVFQRARVSCK
jgi:hypothetical protein